MMEENTKIANNQRAHAEQNMVGRCVLCGFIMVHADELKNHKCKYDWEILEEQIRSSLSDCVDIDIEVGEVVIWVAFDTDLSHYDWAGVMGAVAAYEAKQVFKVNLFIKHVLADGTIPRFVDNLVLKNPQNC